MSNQQLADGILVLHFVIVLFNVCALPVIWIGYLRAWGCVRNFYFRIIHLLLIGFVAAETVLGVICPLTSWENALRSSPEQTAPYEKGFIVYWVHRLIFYDIDARVFIVAYVGFFLLVLATLFWVRPVLPHRLRFSRAR